MEKKVFELDFYGRKLVVEHGQVAKQADGAVLVRYGDTVVLSTSVVSKSANLLSDFFPLMVLYQEKLYSVGKIPGGFIKREGRPTDQATLAARMIDRPLRPLFPEDFKNTTIDDMPFNQFFADFQPVLSDFEQALQNNDSVLIGDLSEYEICPRLKAISTALTKM